MARILVLHGPNLNLLGTREPEVYGHDRLSDINARLVAQAGQRGHELTALQSNAEHVLIDAVHAAKLNGTGCIVINPGAFTHTSVALRDAFLGVSVPFIEVHLSNVYACEAFRHESYLRDIAHGVIIGLGAIGYELAVDAAIRMLEA